MSNNLLPWVMDTAIATAVLIALVLFLRKPTAKYFGPNAAYALWLLPALRTFLPPLPKAPMVAPVVEPLTIIQPTHLTDQIPTMAVEPSSSAMIATLILVWGVGVAAFLMWQTGVYRHTIKRILHDTRNTSESLGTGVKTLLSPAVDGPISFGLFKPVIALPLDFYDRYSEEERECALHHELAHIARRDLWTNAIALFIRALHWPNPFIHIAFRYFRADQEMACDHYVLRSFGGFERETYGRTLLKTVSTTSSLAFCPLNTANQLKERLQMLKIKLNTPVRTAIAASMISGLALTSLGLSATYVTAQEAPKIKKMKREEKRIVISKENGGEGIFVGTDENGEFNVTSLRGDDYYIKIVTCDENGEPIRDTEANEDAEARQPDAIFCENRDTAVPGDKRTLVAEKAALQQALHQMKEDEKREAERRKRTIDQLEMRLKELEKAEKKQH